MISLMWHQTSEVVKVVALVTSQQALDGEEDGAHVIECWPLVLQDVQTDESLFVHIRMETGSDKLHTRSLVWITSRKLQGQPVPETLIHLRHTDTRVNKPCCYWSSHLYNIYWLFIYHSHVVNVLSPELHRWFQPIWRDYLTLERRRCLYHRTSAMSKSNRLSWLPRILGYTMRCEFISPSIVQLISVNISD